MKRRGFLLSMAAVAATTVVGGFSRFADAAAKLIDMSGKKRKDKVNAQAVKAANNINYVADAAKAFKDGSKKPVAKPAVNGFQIDAKLQRCHNCNFYKGKIELSSAKVDTKDAAACMLIPGVLVHAKGWCSTWTQSPKAKKA